MSNQQYRDGMISWLNGVKPTTGRVGVGAVRVEGGSISAHADDGSSRERIKSALNETKDLIARGLINVSGDDGYGIYKINDIHVLVVVSLTFLLLSSSQQHTRVSFILFTI